MIRGGKNKAFTLVEIVIVVAILGILLAISVPGYLKARERARQHTCQENLLQIDSALQRWIIDENIPNNAAITIPMSYLVDEIKYIRNTPNCPSSGVYTFGFANDAMPVECTWGNRVEWPHKLQQELAQGS